MRDNLKPHAEIELQPLSFASGNREGAASVSASGLILKEHLLGVLVVVCMCPSSQHNVVDKRPENDTNAHPIKSLCLLSLLTHNSLQHFSHCVPAMYFCW